ncbi:MULTISPECIES: hypothetical protein [unclassified Neisseria]|uniref:hypothetical protein n=1 Tax=unclassified Neisseria TaxID=2623750 RepID=UPI001072E220|nr:MULTISPECIES: hypothetical protein [unclassified Neisseria]MBF0802821.1 hypothetical protein [Neisseria sp. 19428wB4_WF04]TFU44611.1 hypothetical protein E4T99_00295 [Neisseria sp. WF04]
MQTQPNGDMPQSSARRECGNNVVAKPAAAFAPAAVFPARLRIPHRFQTAFPGRCLPVSVSDGLNYFPAA